jgi:hypothetical protein
MSDCKSTNAQDFDITDSLQDRPMLEFLGGKALQYDYLKVYKAIYCIIYMYQMHQLLFEF